jgi:anti-sigma factor RsiW
MSAVYPQSVCARVREQVSLELDGELSQLEQRMLAAHLERCGACATYADDVRDLTDRIRSAPLHSLRRPVVVRRKRHLSTTRVQIGVAAAFALAALGLGTQLASAPAAHESTLTRYDATTDLSPPSSVLEREQAILRVVKVGRGLPPAGSVL